jgi:hypothetical protein
MAPAPCGAPVLLFLGRLLRHKLTVRLWGLINLIYSRSVLCPGTLDAIPTLYARHLCGVLQR